MGHWGQSHAPRLITRERSRPLATPAPLVTGAATMVSGTSLDGLIDPLHKLVALLLGEVVFPAVNLPLPHERAFFGGHNKFSLLPVSEVTGGILSHVLEVRVPCDVFRFAVRHRLAQELGDLVHHSNSVLMKLLVRQPEYRVGMIQVALGMLPVRTVQHFTSHEPVVSRNSAKVPRYASYCTIL